MHEMRIWAGKTEVLLYYLGQNVTNKMVIDKMVADCRLI